MQVTGSESNSQIAKLTFSTLKALKSFASFESQAEGEQKGDASKSTTELAKHEMIEHAPGRNGVGLNFSYTINLNLPATTDQGVFNAIFRSLKEHLLST